MPDLLERVEKATANLSGNEASELVALSPWPAHTDEWLLFGKAICASLDAAVGLVERVRPEAGWTIDRYWLSKSKGPFYSVEMRWGLGGEKNTSHAYDLATPALALLAALLKSMKGDPNA
jgi:hypothetical protein